MVLEAVLDQQVAIDSSPPSPLLLKATEQRIFHSLIPLLIKATQKTTFDPDGNITVIEEGFGLDGLRIQNPTTEEMVHVWTEKDTFRIVHNKSTYIVRRDGTFLQTEYLDPENHITGPSDNRQIVQGMSGQNEVIISYSNGTTGYWSEELGQYLGATFDPTHITDHTLIREYVVIDGYQGLEYHVVHTGEIPIETYWNLHTGVLLGTVSHDIRSFELPEGYTQITWA